LNRLGKQEYLALRAGAEVLEADHCGEKVLRLVDGSILKLFRHKRLLSSATFFPYARRFAANAAALAGLGVPVPHILRIARVPSIGRDAVLYQPLAGQTLRELLRAGIADDEARRLKAMLTRFIIMLHDKGVYFRSLHLGNVVLTPRPDRFRRPAHPSLALGALPAYAQHATNERACRGARLGQSCRDCRRSGAGGNRRCPQLTPRG